VAAQPRAADQPPKRSNFGTEESTDENESHSEELSLKEEIMRTVQAEQGSLGRFSAYSHAA
jgi:hypothetical protein